MALGAILTRTRDADKGYSSKQNNEQRRQTEPDAQLVLLEHEGAETIDTSNNSSGSCSNLTVPYPL